MEKPHGQKVYTNYHQSGERFNLAISNLLPLKEETGIYFVIAIKKSSIYVVAKIIPLDICNTAKQFIIGFLEQLSMTGKINPANSIFYLKNWAGYSDTVTMEPISTVKRVLSAGVMTHSYLWYNVTG